MRKSFRILFSVSTVLLLLGFTQFAKGQTTPKELAQQLLKDDEMVREVTQNDGLTLNQIAERLTSKKIDLNGDGVVEYIVSGIGCGNANCPHWIYRKTGNKYIQIPVENELSAASVKTRRTKTTGYLDLDTQTHAGSGEGSLLVYKFNGSKYVVKECFDVKAGYVDRNGTFHNYKTPKVTKGNCN